MTNPDAGGGAEFSRFLGYAYRSLKEIVTCVELAHRLYPSLSPASVDALIDEGNQISRIVHACIQRLGSPLTGDPDLGAHDS